MKWDIFSGRRGEKKSAELDQMSEQIKRIEKFAPRKYKSERASFYYNYQLMDAYFRPLSALLAVLSQKQRLHSDEEGMVSDLFLKLKEFYDVGQRLSVAEAIQDKNLQRRFIQLFLIFYDQKDVAKLKTYLEKLKMKG
ncbi:MAG: hypothetical protein PVH99_03975 [Desulfobacteraceae bacterium]